MVIELNNVRVAYQNTPHQPVLSISNWTVNAAEQVFVHGPSGCGKSTLLNLLSGLLVPKTGQVSILNHRLEQMSRRQRDKFRANHIGYVFQQFNLIPYLNAIENVQLASRFCKHDKRDVQPSEIKALLEQLNLASSDWYKQASVLSIGQQQRVAIARALVNKPQLLLADEPTSSLDQHNRDNFMSMLMLLVQQSHATLVFVSHDLSLSGYFNRVDALSEISDLQGAG